ncbi:MAG TPA: AAA family ATPase [Kofleriaceae bacterium]
MLRDLRISGFRGLREFAMSGLGRVNLLVGTNNCGKTSVLEAIHMLTAPGTAAPLWLAQSRRGEFVDSGTEKQVDVTHLLHGHKLAGGIGFRIVGNGTAGEQVLVAEFVARKLESRGLEENGHDAHEGDDERDVTVTGSLVPLFHFVSLGPEHQHSRASS